jgi:transposase
MLLDEMHEFYINGFPITPDLYLHELNEIKDTNNQFAEWFDENIEKDNSTNKNGKLINALTKHIIKERLEEDLKINYKDAKIRDNFKKLGFIYDKTLCIDYKRGGFRGIKFKKKYFNSSSDSDSD